MTPLLIIATRNAHKVGEIRFNLGPAFEYHTLSDFVGSPQVIEDAPTFEGNARKKAEELARWLAANSDSRILKQVTRLFVLADDSGLEVDALDGAPGVHSARFAALDTTTPGNSSDGENNAKLLQLMADVSPARRTARFRCVMAFTQVTLNTGETRTDLFDGACEGRIGFEPHGRNGFGYDPLFFPIGSEKAFAQLSREQKNEISHRARALAKLKKHLRNPRNLAPQ